MTVKKLIEELQKWDDSAIVTMVVDDSDYSEGVAIWPPDSTKHEHIIWFDDED